MKAERLHRLNVGANFCLAALYATTAFLEISVEIPQPVAIEQAENPTIERALYLGSAVMAGTFAATYRTALVLKREVIE